MNACDFLIFLAGPAVLIGLLALALVARDRLARAYARRRGWRR